jgi:hypothetical protein
MLLSIVQLLYAQNRNTDILTQIGKHSVTYDLAKSDSSFTMPKEFIIEGSESILLDSTKQLAKDLDYQIDYRYGRITLSLKLLEKIFSDSSRHSLTINFQALPHDFKRVYSLHQVEVRKDSTGKNSTFVSKSTSNILTEDLFGPGLQKSGSIVRGFSIGSNRDLSLSSGFRMQLAGKLTKDVDVTAALTDENSPIQPEGTTQTLREVDKVYVEIKHPQYAAILGDFNLQIDQSQGGEFGRINRKLQGARGIASFEGIGGSTFDGSLSLTGATSRGKYTSNQFHGLEGVQGPYRLTGPNGESHLLIIAGSERVYLNGELMTRGEVNDYIIDYASGEITFSSKRLIIPASRITIDFEYSDQQFTRNLFAGSISGNAFNNSVKVNALVMQEADDPDSPIDFSLDDSKRSILSQSGADRFKASLSGIVYMGIDSITGRGKGNYFTKDTIINGHQYSILVYAPGDSLALYTAYFSSVEQIPADTAGYTRISAGHFQFAGLGQGNYLPRQFIPMPQRHQVIELNGEATIGDISFSGEYAASKYHHNRFSDLEGSQLKGGAFTIHARYNPKQIRIGNTNLGELDAKLSNRYIDRQFIALDRLNEVEFDRKWNLSKTTMSDEEISELSIIYSPINMLRSALVYGKLNRPGELHSDRTQINVGLSDSSLSSIQYQIEKINTSSTFLLSESHWTRQRGTAEYEILKWRPGIRIEAEERTEKPNGSDSLRLGSFRFIEIAPRFTTAEYARMVASVELQLRTEDSAIVGTQHRALKSLTQLYTWQYTNPQLLTSSLTFNIRKVEFTNEFRQRGNSNSDGVLVRSQSRYTPFQRAVETDLYYEFSNQRSAQMERYFIRVAKGNGNYRYLGDTNGNAIPDENDFELARFDGDYIVVYLPSDQLYPVADLKASIRLRLQPAKFVQTTNRWWHKLLKIISTETYLRVDEKSKNPDTKQIYLLNFSQFLNEQMTITGSQQFTQDVFIFENNPELSFRLRHSNKNGLTQFVSTIERSHMQEQSIRIRLQLIPEIGNQTDIIRKVDKVNATTHSTRERDLLSHALISDFSYRPMNNFETGFNFGVTEVTNSYIPKNATATINEEGIRIIQSFPTIGQLRAELKREEVVLSNITDPPYEMTSGKVPGQSYLWQLTFEYRITNNLQLSVNYNGRKEGVRNPIHFARMEARAFF